MDTDTDLTATDALEAAQGDAVERGGADTPPAPAKAAQMVERLAVYFWAGAARPFIGKVDVPAWCREGVLDNWKG